MAKQAVIFGALIAVLLVLGILTMRGALVRAQVLKAGERLASACDAGDEAAARRALADGADPNYRRRGSTGAPVELAVESGSLACVRHVYAAGGRSPLGDSWLLLTAANGGHVAIADYLRSVGADPNGGIGPDHLPPLFYARSGRAAAYLVAHGANVNAVVDHDLATPLHAAAYSDKHEVVKALLALGADPTIANAMGLTPLDIATGDSRQVLRNATPPTKGRTVPRRNAR